MKSLNIIFALLLFILSATNAISQEGQSNSSKQDFYVINNLNDLNKNVNELVQSGNIVQVNQMGWNNKSDLTVISKKSSVVVNQDGLNNYINLYKKSDELLQSVGQSGNNNFISDFSLIDENQININVKQEGNNLSLYNNGSNSISKNMKITQSGNSGRIYIFNH